MRHHRRSYLYPEEQFVSESDEELAAAWWVEEPLTETECWPAHDYLEDALKQGSDDLLSMIAVIVAAPDDDRLGYVGAGLLEDAVTHWRWAKKYLPGVEDRARQDARFRRAVEGIWLGSRTLPEVVERLLPLGAKDITKPRPEAG